MKIKFLKDYRYPGGGYSNKGDVQTFEDAEFAKWAIDNGFAEEVKESGWWKPMTGDRYYFIDDSGYIKEAIWGDNFWDVDRYKLGNAFKTEAAGKRYSDFLKAIATVRQDDGVLTPEQIIELGENNGQAYHVGNIGARNSEEVLCGCTMDFSNIWAPVGVILFDTKEHANASCKKYQDEWKIILNYDWSRE